jgi:acyl dehydratase
MKRVEPGTSPAEGGKDAGPAPRGASVRRPGAGNQTGMGRKTYLEDFEAGETIDLGRVTVTREEIVEFARRFDPQPFHLDEEAARRSIFGGLIASGWHTASLFMRLLVDGMIDGSQSMGSPGIDELRWRAPVRPGDTLQGQARVLEVVPSRSRPDRGHIRTAYEFVNQDGVTVMTMIGRGIFARRPDGTAKEAP